MPPVERPTTFNECYSPVDIKLVNDKENNLTNTEKAIPFKPAMAYAYSDYSDHEGWCTTYNTCKLIDQNKTVYRRKLFQVFSSYSFS